VKEIPILFIPELAQAIFEGRKTVTRRPVKPQPTDDPSSSMPWVDDGPTPSAAGRTGHSLRLDECPFGVPGDRLWVRENFQRTTDACGDGVIVYAADNSAYYLLAEDNGEGDLCGVGAKTDRSRCQPIDRWRPSIHMPRWACRTVLEVVSVRVERLQAMTERDAIDEGAMGLPNRPTYEAECEAERAVGKIKPPIGDSPLKRFATRWKQIYGEGSWEANPWVWVVEFKRVAGGAA